MAESVKRRFASRIIRFANVSLAFATTVGRTTVVVTGGLVTFVGCCCCCCCCCCCEEVTSGLPIINKSADDVFCGGGEGVWESCSFARVFLVGRGGPIEADEASVATGFGGVFFFSGGLVVVVVVVGTDGGENEEDEEDSEGFCLAAKTCLG